MELNWLEYSVFFLMLAASMLIGIYHGWFRGPDTVVEFMLGGRNMKVFPVTISLVATYVSGITLIGVPSEIYRYGTQHYAVNIGIVVAGIVTKIFYLPVLYKLKSPSIYEYLEKRFDRSVMLIGSLIFTLNTFGSVPVILYIPSLALNQVTGIFMYKLALIVCAVCIFYTSLGGLKAVLWSDTFQAIFTISTVTALAIIGLRSVGGIENVVKSNLEGQRLELFNMDFDPFLRATFPSVFFGSIFYWLSYFAANAGTYQRYASLRSYGDAKTTANWMIFGLVLIKSIMTPIGLIIYTKYKGCDPLITGSIQKPGQLLPYYVMDVAQDYPGFMGLFMSGVATTALSALSTHLNSMALTIYENFIKPTRKITEKRANLIMKFMTIVLGILSTGMVFLIARLGTLIQVAHKLNGVTNGVLLYLFTLGMFCPWANAKSAIIGTISSFATMVWLSAGAQVAIFQGRLRFPGKFTSIANCPINSTQHLNLSATEFGYRGYGTIVEADGVSMLYRISYHYYPFIGFLVGMIVANVVSFFFNEKQDISKLDRGLIVPQLGFLIIKKQRESKDEYSMVSTYEVDGEHSAQ